MEPSFPIVRAAQRDDLPTFRNEEKYAREMDKDDPLVGFKNEFLFPKTHHGNPALYFAGNSLGLQPQKAQEYLQTELEDWSRWGVEGHLHARNPWLPYHEKVTDPLARLVGALPQEVVTMNTLTVNLHLMMVSFYRPTSDRYKILIEGGAFPSDQYAVASQARFHGYDPKQAVITLHPREGEACLRLEDILTTLDREGDQIALVLLGNVNYLTGQAFDIRVLTQAAHASGCHIGFDLAHGAGNLLLQLHDWGPDFAVWCSYKYLNSGPGALAGCFVHERHLGQKDIPRFEGWWGQNKQTRFEMLSEFDPIPTVEAWQLSNPPIFQLAAMRASLELFDRATISQLRKKSEGLTGYLEFLLSDLPASICTQVTPRDPGGRGAQLSFRFHQRGEELVQALSDQGVIADFRKPNILRFAPVPLYCSYTDVFHLGRILKQQCQTLN
jgi:kynureninase